MKQLQHYALLQRAWTKEVIIIRKVKETQRETETSSGINEGCVSSKITVFSIG